MEGDDTPEQQAPPGSPIPPGALENLPQPLRDALSDPGAKAQLLGVAAFAGLWAGPYPPPEMIRGYEDVLPGSADRIIKMAEEQQRHRHSLEKTTVVGASKRAWWGLWLGFVISLVVLGLGTMIILEGYTWEGASIMGVDVVALAGVFVYGRIDQRKERVEKNARTQLLPGQPE